LPSGFIRAAWIIPPPLRLLQTKTQLVQPFFASGSCLPLLLLVHSRDVPVPVGLGVSPDSPSPSVASHQAAPGGCWLLRWEPGGHHHPVPKPAVMRTPASPHTAPGTEDAHEQQAALGPASMISVWVGSYDLNPTQPVTEAGHRGTANTFFSFFGRLFGVYFGFVWVFWGIFLD